MNALKYLVVDRSLDSEKEVVGRFQMGESGAIPDFEANVDGLQVSAKSPRRLLESSNAFVPANLQKSLTRRNLVY